MKIPRSVYFVGIGGIGMSALAQYFKHRGARVAGSDREESPVTRMLREQGITASIGHTVSRRNLDTLDGVELIIYSDAVPSSEGARVRAREAGIPELSYFEALGAISKGHRTIAVSGTHGKTTTTAMLAKILHACGKKPTAIVGSIVKDFPGGAGGSNFLPGLPDARGRELFVIEACEYRDHLLKLSPEILVVTNIELDHTDYFPNLEALQATFRKAVENVPREGCVVTDPYDPVIAGAIGAARAPIIDYTTQTVPRLRLIGEFNAMNARAAKAAARAAFPHLQEQFIDRALADFRGSWRRFEYKGETPAGALVYDDYAHHPTAIRKTIDAAREEFPDKKITVVFHPHLYSRTRDLFDGFAGALAGADSVILAPIYAAREEERSDISSDMLASAIEKTNPRVLSLASFDDIRAELLERAGENDLVITMGAGDIYKVAEQIAD